MRNRRKWYSLLLVGLILILATSVMACGLPAPAPAPVPAPAPKLAPVPAQTLAPAPAPKTITPATTPTPSPKPTSPIGQTEQGIEDGWVRLKIQDVGSIDYPTDFLELQSQDYRDITKETSPSLTALVFRLGKSDFTLQQVGLNDLLPSSFNEYRRVMFKTVHLNPGEDGIGCQ